MNIINAVLSSPMPFLSLLLPFAVSMVIFSLRLYHRFIREKTGKALYVDRKFLRITFLSVFVINVIFTLTIWINFVEKGTVFYILSSNGWTNTIGGESKIRALLQIDAIGAVSAVMMGLVALSAAFAALADKINPLAPTKAAFFMLTLCGIQGIFYSNGLIALSVFILFGQIGASGLYRGVPSGKSDLKKSFWYYFSRIAVILMFFAGSFLVFEKYGTDNIAILSNLIVSGNTELAAFILLIVPLLYLFLKNSAYVKDAGRRCFFGIRAQAAFFVIFRIIFSLYGSMPGLEKIPALFILIGFLTLFSSLILSPLSYDPLSFTEKMEMYLKSLMLITLGFSMSGMSSAEAMTMYGISAIESMISVWILYLPLSAALSVLCVNLKKREGDYELWEYGALFNKMPATGCTLFLIVCIIGGLPPFCGFAAKQFLFRAAYDFNPLYMVVIFAASFGILVYGVRYVSGIMFVRRGLGSCLLDIRERSIALPLSLIALIFAVTTVAPGFFFDRGITPSVSTLMNKTQVIITSPQGGDLK